MQGLEATRLRTVRLGLLVAGGALAAPKLGDALRASKFFKVDVQQKQITATADYIQPALRLDLAALATDQPQYWPNEKVYLKVLALSRGGQTLTGTWQRRDAASSKVEVKLNADGVAVLQLLDGEKQWGGRAFPLPVVGKCNRGLGCGCRAHRGGRDQ